MEIDKDKLKKMIKQGKSSHDAAMSFGCSPSTVRRKAAEIGLRFSAKTTWRNDATRHTD